MLIFNFSVKKSENLNFSQYHPFFVSKDTHSVFKVACLKKSCAANSGKGNNPMPFTSKPDTQERNRCFWSAVEQSILQGSWPRPRTHIGNAVRCWKLSHRFLQEPTEPNHTSSASVQKKKKITVLVSLMRFHLSSPKWLNIQCHLNHVLIQKKLNQSLYLLRSHSRNSRYQTEIRCLQNSQTGWKRRHQQRPMIAPK